MEAVQFDRWTTRWATTSPSRRGLLRLALGGGFGLLGFDQVAEEALACRRNGKPCAKGQRNGDCCSGTCRKGKCRPTPGAKGCTVNSGDYCDGDQLDIKCPQNPDGFCVLLDSGKPFCMVDVDCSGCTSHADCTLRANGKCVKTCPRCGTATNNGCVYPQF
jgi:hypothetical protein